MSGHCPICGNWGDECCCDTLRDERFPILISGYTGDYYLSYKDADAKRVISERYGDIGEVLEQLQTILYIGGWK